MKACIIGLGRAGLPLAAVMADAGIQVTGVDVDEKRVADVDSGVNPIPEEKGLTELLKRKKIKATTDIKEARDCSVYVVIVPLFLKGHEPDFTALDAAFNDVALVLTENDLVILETTVPPGTTEDRVKRILDEPAIKYHLAYSPERIMTGYSISRFKEFPKVVGGVTPEATEKAYGFYSKFNDQVVKVRDARTAELVKVAEGVYRDVNIALANELYRVCGELDIDFWSMREAANHRFCNIHEPGMVGGHCIPVYPWFLINEHNVPLIRTAREINDSMADYYADRAAEIAGEGGKVGVIGLSYRDGVREAVHTQAHRLIQALRDRKMEVYGLDPLFTHEEVEELFKVKPLMDAGGMDAVIVTGHADVDLDPRKAVDVKNTIKP